jgi:hypothetical protein
MQSRLLSLGIAMEFGQEMSLNLTKLFGELFAELLKVALRCGSLPLSSIQLSAYLVVLLLFQHVIQQDGELAGRVFDSTAQLLELTLER